MTRNFLEFLGECNGGAFVLDCADQLKEVLKAIEDTGKTGSLTIDLKVEPNGDGTVTVKATLKAKKPTRQRAPSVFYIHRDGLRQDHPKQTPMFDEKANVRNLEDVPRKVKDNF
jgi:hypothetical protein